MPLLPQELAVAPGSVVGGRYRLAGRLGRGGMADVYDGVDLRLERPVAVKLLRPEMAAREDVRLRFQAEARAAAGISHPNAVHVFDTGEHHGAPFLVMERLPGDTLADRIEAGTPETAWLREGAQGVLAALGVAHRAGIVHRDVKPGNILIATDGTPKITDFGIAKSVSSDSGSTRADLTASGQLLGTPAYLAPERLEGGPATPRSDLWAFGVVLYEALAGRKPFTGHNSLAIAQAIVTGDHVPLDVVRPDLDPGLTQSIERALARDPNERFATADEMAAALDLRTGPVVDGAFAADRTTVMPVFDVPEAEPPPPVPRSHRVRPVRRANPRRALLWVLALVVVLLIAGVLSNRNPSSPSTARQSVSTTVSQGLAKQMQDMADALTTPTNGARAPQLATLLRDEASSLQSGDPGMGNEAIGDIVTVAAWAQTGQLDSATAAKAIGLLRQVPGASGVVATTPATGPATVAPTVPSTDVATTVTTTPATPAAAAGPRPYHGKGRDNAPS